MEDAEASDEEMKSVGEANVMGNLSIETAVTEEETAKNIELALDMEME